MSADVIDLDEARAGWMNSFVRCSACDHRAIATHPSTATKLECNACGQMTMRAVSEDEWKRPLADVVEIRTKETP